MKPGGVLTLPFLAVSVWASDLQAMLHLPCLEEKIIIVLASENYSEL